MTARGIHVLDAMIHLCGPVTRVFAMSERRQVADDVDDTTSMLLRFSGGASASLATVMATGDFWRLHVLGSKGWIEMHGVRALTVSDLDRVVETTRFEPVDIERAELEAFADAITAGTPFAVSSEEAVNGVATLEAIVLSAERGAPVDVG